MKLNIFQERFLDLMLENEMTQNQIAKRLVTTQPTINRYLKGEREPDLDTLLRICDLFETDPNYLLGYDNKEVRVNINHYNIKIENDMEEQLKNDAIEEYEQIQELKEFKERKK